MSLIKKAVIPAAGLGTRFLPATKGVAKELFPIVDKPAILYQVEEAISAGVEEIIFIISPKKESIKKMFSREIDFENHLIESGHPEYAELIKNISTLVKFTFVYQNEQKGLGHAVYQTKEAVGNNPFLLLLGDDLVYNWHGDSPSLQLAKAFEKTNKSILGVQAVPYELTYKYGIMDPKNKEGRLMELNGMIEKPKSNPPSNYAVIGRYVLTPDIFTYLENQEPGANGEIQLTDSIKKLDRYYAYDLDATYYDIGSKLGFVKAIIDFSLSRDDIGEEVKNFIKSK